VGGIYSLTGIPKLHARRDGKAYDPRIFITPDNPQVRSIAEQTKAENVLSSLRNALNWVSSNIEFRSERGEFFRYASETLEEGIGDCEDMAILLQSIVEAQGIEGSYVALGILNGQGHAWNEYWQDEDWLLDATGNLMVEKRLAEGYRPLYYFSSEDYFKAVAPLYELC